MEENFININNCIEILEQEENRILQDYKKKSNEMYSIHKDEKYDIYEQNNTELSKLPCKGSSIETNNYIEQEETKIRLNTFNRLEKLEWQHIEEEIKLSDKRDEELRKLPYVKCKLDRCYDFNMECMYYYVKRYFHCYQCRKIYPEDFEIEEDEDQYSDEEFSNSESNEVIDDDYYYKDEKVHSYSILKKRADKDFIHIDTNYIEDRVGWPDLIDM